MTGKPFSSPESRAALDVVTHFVKLVLGADHLAKVIYEIDEISPIHRAQKIQRECGNLEIKLKEMGESPQIIRGSKIALSMLLYSTMDEGPRECKTH
jgi:hypothetical protein